ncbi:MAG: hypothetical protein Q4C80_01435 [Bacillota bacterium]|nr:hypothetical protein [Bacillota bacterium]
MKIVSEGKNKNTGIIIAIIVIAVVGAAVLTVALLQKAKENEYRSNLESMVNAILEGGSEAETTGNLICNVWDNAISEKRDDETNKYTIKNGKFVEDFNDALTNLFEDESYTESVSKIKESRSNVNVLMKQLRNPPKEYEAVYTDLKELYENYLKLTSMVINPRGSYNEFSEELNKYDMMVLESFEKVDVYLE